MSKGGYELYGYANFFYTCLSFLRDVQLFTTIYNCEQFATVYDNFLLLTTNFPHPTDTWTVN